MSNLFNNILIYSIEKFAVASGKYAWCSHLHVLGTKRKSFEKYILGVLTDVFWVIDGHSQTHADRS